MANILDKSDVKNFLGIPSAASADDTLITTIIAQIEAEIKTYCKRKYFQATSLTEYYDGDGTDILLLKEYPIVSVTSLYDDTDRVYGSDTKIGSADIIIYGDEGYIRLDGLSFTKGEKNIKITYKAGYGTGTGETAMPEDLKLALVMLASAVYLEGKAGVNVFENQEITYRPNQLRKDGYKIFDRYKKIR